MVDHPTNAAIAYIVDDNFHNRTVARIALEDIGYTVEDTEIALTRLKRSNNVPSTC